MAVTKTIFLELTERQAFKMFGLVDEAIKEDPDDRELCELHTLALRAWRSGRSLRRLPLARATGSA
jgi:hypothetical protein